MTDSTRGDSPELEALFDSIAASYAAELAPAAASAASSPAAGAGQDNVFSQIGHMTRKLHDALRELGYDKKLEQAVEAIPDAQDRLNYIATLTERAAERVLNATEAAQPLQERLEADARQLGGKWDALYANKLSVEEFKELARSTRDYLKRVPEATDATNAQLMEIMMAQDFQDLTGQVIKKIMALAQGLEQQLLQILLFTTPAEKRAEIETSLLNGPVVNPEGRTDVVTSQGQVDDLLASLGF